MSFDGCFNPAKLPSHASVISHTGIVSPFATADLVCESCGSKKRRRTSGPHTICAICGNDNEPILQSVFTAQQLRES